MQRRTFLGAAGGLALLGGGGFLGYELFAPEQASEANEDRTDGTDGTDDGSAGDGERGEATTDESASEGASTDGSDESPDDDGGATILKRGEFTGKDGHECSGTVELAEDDAGRFLQFRHYEQTQGPDVYCYLTPAPDPDTDAAIEAGTKVRIAGGADGGEMTKIGTFAQSLPPEADPEGASGVGVWCDEFSVPFGAATLEDA